MQTTIPRRSAVFGLAAAGASLSAPAWAKPAYPDKPISFIVGFSPGGGSDTVARLTAERLSTVFGQSVVVENRAGAGGRIASEFVAKSRPDGYTILIASASFAIDPALYKHLPFDPIHGFEPVSLIASAPYVLAVNPSVPAHSVAELIALAKQEPGKLNDASAGPGSALDLAFRLFRSMAGVNVVEVSYQGANGIPDLVAGRVQMTFAGLPQTAAYIKSGKLRALAVTTPQRSALAPDLPTIAETLPGYAVTSWYGALAPAGTPPAVVNALGRAIASIMKEPAVRQRFTTTGLEPDGSNPAAFSQTITSEIAKWKKIAREAHLTLG